MGDFDLKAAFEARFGTARRPPEPLDGNPVLSLMAARGSCRAFTSEPVSAEILDTLAAVALAAPSKSDLQQRDILVVDDTRVATALRDLLGAQAWIAGVPSFVVFLANNRRQRQVQNLHDQPFPNDHLDAFFNASMDAGIALAFFMIAAEASGLGCCPISTIRNDLPQVRALLGLPDHVFPVAGMAVGYPGEKPRISPRLDLGTTLHRNQFSDCTAEALERYDTRRSQETGSPAWSFAKARMYASPQRGDFGEFIRSIGFKTD